MCNRKYRNSETPPQTMSASSNIHRASPAQAQRPAKFTSIPLRLLTLKMGRSNLVKPTQTQSDPIRPNPTTRGPVAAAILAAVESGFQPGGKGVNLPQR